MARCLTIAVCQTGPIQRSATRAETIGRLIHLLEQAVRVRMIEESTGIKTPFSNMPEKEKDFAIRLNKLCSLSAQQAIITELDKATYYIERNAHAKMLFHALCIRLLHIIKDNSLILVN